MARRGDLGPRRRRQPLHRRGDPSHQRRSRRRTRVLTADLEGAGMVDAKYQVTGIGPTVAGRNGGGDLYYTDGEIWMLRLVEACRKRDGPAVTIPSPPATELKDQIWHAIADAMGNRLRRQCRDSSRRVIRGAMHATRSNQPFCGSGLLRCARNDGLDRILSGFDLNLRLPPTPETPRFRVLPTRNKNNDRSRGPGISGHPRDPPPCPTKCCGRCIVRRSTSIPRRCWT